MELKPTKSHQPLRPRLDGLGNPVRAEDHKNPWAQLARGMEPQGAKRRKTFVDTLGATPPRDGPFAHPAADVAVTKPPATRRRQQRLPGSPAGGIFVTKK